MKNIGSNEYIIAPDVLSNRKYLEDFASKSFTFFFKRLKRSYPSQLKHFRKHTSPKKIYSLMEGFQCSIAITKRLPSST